MADGRTVSGFTGIVSLSAHKMSRLYLADHLLRDGVGHHLGYNLALADAAARRGIGVELVTGLGFDSALAPGVKARAIFRRDFRADPPRWIARNFRLLAWLEQWCDARFAGDLRRLSMVASDDAIFAQMIAPRHFLRWIAWLRVHQRAPVLLLHLGYRPERFAFPQIGVALASLTAATRRRLVFITDSEKLTAPFSEALDAPVHHLPHVISYPLQESAAKGSSITVYLAGNARREKGFADVVDAVRRIFAEGNVGGLRIVLQCNHPDDVSAEVLRERPEGGQSLEWIDKVLSDEVYVARLADADVVLLPYHTDLYSMRTSGIFCECRASGKPVVATRGTWAGDRVAREGGGWLVEERDAAALATVLRKIPQEIAEISAQARALAPAARREFDRDTLMDGMVKLDREARRA